VACREACVMPVSEKAIEQHVCAIFCPVFFGQAKNPYPAREAQKGK